MLPRLRAHLDPLTGRTDTFHRPPWPFLLNENNFFKKSGVKKFVLFVYKQVLMTLPDLEIFVLDYSFSIPSTYTLLPLISSPFTLNFVASLGEIQLSSLSFFE